MQRAYDLISLQEWHNRCSAAARLYYIISLYVFRLTIDVCYIGYVSVSFSDDPVTPLPLNIVSSHLYVSYFLLLPAALLSPFGKKDLSGLFYFAALAFLYVPLTSMVGLNSNKSVVPVLIVGFALVISGFWIAMPRPQLRLNSSKRRRLLVVTCSFLFVAFFVFWSVATGAIWSGNLNLEEIYSHRERLSAVLDRGPIAYLNLWAQKVANPFLIAVGLVYRRHWIVFACVVLQVYFFVVTQHRTHLFVPVLIFFVYLVFKRDLKFSDLYIFASLALGVFLACSNYFDLEHLMAVVVRRGFFVAASVVYDWIEYFRSNPHVYFADNLLKKFVANEYTGQNLPALMSLLAFPGREQAFGFNVGLVGAGYAQAGLIGVFFYATLIALSVWLVNGLIEQGLPVFLAAVVLFEPIRTAWADSDAFTAILSHGILFGILLLWIHGASPSSVDIAGQGVARKEAKGLDEAR